MKTLIMTLVIITSLGCTHMDTSKLNGISIGMSKADVVTHMGNPNGTAGYANDARLIYRLEYNQSGWEQDYCIKLIDGTVRAYGRCNDWGMSSNPTYNVNVKSR